MVETQHTVIEGLASVILPVFNRPEFLREAAGQVFAQTYRPVELVIVDDGSTDSTPRVCAELAAERPDLVRVVRRENGGPGAARESGRLAARGEFLQYLDSDDHIEPAKIERQVAALRAHPECGIAYCKTREYTIGQQPTDRCSQRTGERFERLFPHVLSGPLWPTITPLFRRSLADRIGPWTSLRQEEDWEYDARAAALGVRLVYIDDFLASARNHAGPRASGGGLGDPVRMRDRARAHLLILEHALRAAVPLDAPDMRHFARELFLLARQCGAAGLAGEARQLFGAALRASGPERARGADFRLYRLVAATVGWRAAGRLACWMDRFRAGPAAEPS